MSCTLTHVDIEKEFCINMTKLKIVLIVMLILINVEPLRIDHEGLIEWVRWGDTRVLRESLYIALHIVTLRLVISVMLLIIILTHDMKGVNKDADV